MSKHVSTQEISERIDVSTATVNRLPKKDENFPKPKRIGRTNYFDLDEFEEWLKSRANNSAAIRADDKIISGARVLELVGRSKAWLWLNVIKPQKLTRVNLSPDPNTDKLINYFIEREIFETYGDLIEVSKSAEQVA